MQSVSHIVDYLRRGERLTAEDAVVLWREAPLWLLSELALSRKRAVSGELVYYNRNIHIEPSNVCLFNCEFCSFRRRVGDVDAWFLTLDEIEERARKMQGTGITEVHIVGGVHPDHTIDLYCEMIRRIKALLPNVAVKAYTAVEISYMSRREGISLEEGLRRLQAAGMESIPGGGAEIFDEELRSKICPDKCSSEEWLAVHRAAHNMGIDTNCTMLYGHIETIEQRVDHLNRLRQLQDEAPGFNAFIPLKYRSRNNRMSEVGECSVEDDMRMIAMSRIFLDNIPHIKAYWVAYGKSTTEMALAFGADDIDGTIDDSTKIYSMAGADARPTMSVEELEALVRDAGFVAVERDTHYNEIRRSTQPAATMQRSQRGQKIAIMYGDDPNSDARLRDERVDKEVNEENNENRDMKSVKSSNKGSEKGSESGFRAMYKRNIVLWTILSIGAFGLLLILLLYFGLMIFTRHNKSIVVPNFIEMNLEEARVMAKDIGLEIVVRDSVYESEIAGGVVIDQMPAPSSVREVKVKPDRKIYLTVNAYARRMIQVPYVANQSLRQAINQLERDGFNIGKLEYVPHTYDGQVVEQKVAGKVITRSTNIKLPYGSSVTLKVGYRSGKQITAVPQLMGMNLSKAKNTLWTSGLNVSKVEYDETVKDLKDRRLARVYMQTQPAKKGVVRGTKVSIYLTCDEKLIDSLSKITDTRSAYYDEQRRLMQKEAEAEAKAQEEERKRLEAEEKARAEAAADSLRLLAASEEQVVESVEGATDVDEE